MGAGSLREAGKEGAGGGISKGGGSQEKWDKFRSIGTTFRNRKSTHRGGNCYRRVREPGVQGTGGGKFRTPCPPPPHLVCYLMQTGLPIN